MPDDLAPRGTDWRNNGIRVVQRAARSGDTPATMGMNRMVAISGSRTNSASLWAGTNNIKADSQTGPHHHGPLESIIYIVSGHAHMRWGDRLEWIAKAGPGDFLQVPAFVPHQEINASATEDLHCVLVRSGPEEIVINIEVDAVDEPQWVSWE